jgi:hypothetical protein
MVRTPLTLLILLAVLGYGAWWGYKTVLTAGNPKGPVTCVTQSATVVVPSQVTVRVLNGGTVRGFASDVAKVLRERGYKVAAVGNTEEQIGNVVVVGADVKAPEVLLVASNFAGVTIRSDARPDHSVDVLLGQKVDGFMPAEGFKTSIEVPGGSVCLPSQTPTPSRSGSPTPAATKS